MDERFELWSGTIKYLQGNIDDVLLDVNLRDIFGHTTSMTRETNAKRNKKDYIKLKSYCIVK